MPVKNISKHSSGLDNGYLYCRNCQGYYPLKDGESKEDFVACQCGWELEFRETLPIHSSHEYPDVGETDETEELELLLTLITSKSEKRKAMIKDLSNHIEIQEELLNEIKEGRWNLWDVLNEKNLQSDIKNQKKLLDDIAKNEDRLLAVTRQQRKKARRNDFSLAGVFNTIGFAGISFILFVIIIVILLFLVV